jgi:hypothetical protein
MPGPARKTLPRQALELVAPRDSEDDGDNQESEASGDNESEGEGVPSTGHAAQAALTQRDDQGVEEEPIVEGPTPPSQGDQEEEEAPLLAEGKVEYSMKDVARWVKKKVELIHVKSLLWDKEKKFGQIRRLQQSIVAKYLSPMLDNSDSIPRIPVRIIVREKGGLYFYA